MEVDADYLGRDARECVGRRGSGSVGGIKVAANAMEQERP